MARSNHSVYSAAMQKAWKSIPKPVPKLTVALVAYPNAYFVRVYEDEVMQYGESDRVAILYYLEEVRKTIESYGTPCHLEGISV